MRADSVGQRDKPSQGESSCLDAAIEIGPNESLNCCDFSQQQRQQKIETSSGISSGGEGARAKEGRGHCTRESTKTYDVCAEISFSHVACPEA